MRETLRDTIAALSSPPGAGLRAVLRLSGPEAWGLGGRLFAPLPARPFRRAQGTLRLPGWPPAPAAALGFRAPRSYTGEDALELWIPGAPPLARAALEALVAAGARLARPGEFTRRAFLRGRLDLPQAEAVLALTSSEDAAQARAGLRALEGGLGRAVDAVKEDLLGLRAEVEAAIDFGEEEDLSLAEDAALAARVEAAAAALAALEGRGEGPRALDGAPRVALRGPVNAGKSSLLNALCGRPAALVSDAPGTTRDVVEATWELPAGAAARLLDTAGGVDGPALSPLDARSRARAEEATAGADLVLWVSEGEPLPAADGLLVQTKADLGRPPLPGALLVSARSGQGLEALSRRVAEALGACAPAGDLLGGARQAGLLRQARAALARAAGALRGRDPARAELCALDLAQALDALGALTGEVTLEDVLDRLFGRFCIGK